jgi:hypothetical protein
MKEVTKNEFMQVIEETRLRLKGNSEWRERYAGYAEEISNNKDTITEVRKGFREWSPLKFYLTVTEAKKAKHFVNFELRYMGQTVAKLTVNKDEIPKLSTRYKYCEEANLRNFNCSIHLPDVDWRGEDAKGFRKFFKKREVTRVDGKRGNKEHYLESLLLTEFSKTKSEEKPLLRIQPVKIAGVRFPMPTYIKASNHKKVEIGYGHIDILARTGTGGKATHLCIMELKDENTKREPPKEVMKQAIAYATFIRELLRSNSGRDWWRLFGFRGEIPEPLELYAICVMPSNNNNNYSFGNMELNIDRDIIKLHYIYFDDEYFIKENKIRIKPGDATIGVVA